MQLSERTRIELLFHWVPKDVFTTITDKGQIAEFCEKAGLHVPRTLVTRVEHDASWIANEASYPCLVKPVHRQTVQFPIAAKVFVAQNVNDLKSFFQTNPQLKGATLVQELIEGGDEQSPMHSTGQTLRRYRACNGAQTTSIPASLWHYVLRTDREK